MRVTQLFGKTSKTEGTDYQVPSHRLLTQAGFIRESTAGRYYLLPLGLKVHDKIIEIVRKHMNAAGAQEVVMPVLHPLELWQETNRTTTTGFELMKIKDRREAEFALGGTAEEMAVDLVRKFNISYKDLPFNIYQFSMKFRDELRARGGLLRVREFVMKDAYSFGTEEQFKAVYQQMWDAYAAIFKELGLDADVVAADNGYIGGEYCHEFISESDQGESRYFIDETTGYAAHEDVAEVILEAVNPEEALLDFQQVHVPAWVQKIADMEKYFKKDKRFMIKSVAYVNSEGDIIVVVIRGDLEVNKTKLEQKLHMVGQLEAASEEDLAAIGTRTGYVHAAGQTFLKPRKAKYAKRDCKVIYVADESLKTIRNGIGGHASFEEGKESEGTNVNYGRDFKHDIELDVAMAQPGMKSKDGGVLVEKKGIEVGNIFQLGYHYSNLMHDAEYTDATGKRQKYYMGCYGIGIGRTLAAVVERFHDEKGIIWPANIAPFQVYLARLGTDENVIKAADELYENITALGIEVLYDDRDTRPGEKFADADLLGIPHRVVVSAKTVSGGMFEYKKRTDSESSMQTWENLKNLLTA
ncbi:MAG TPA: proline--tRNA ligase [Candidatus Saccharimonadales bacterium]|nr:proline--tRNA ligase [Candidatus Saccharimonadales bacterium]